MNVLSETNEQLLQSVPNLQTRLDLAFAPTNNAYTATFLLPFQTRATATGSTHNSFPPIAGRASIVSGYDI